MPTDYRLAISYSRFSDPSQAAGDSEDRQSRMFAEFCRRHVLTPAGEAFIDRGRSGYTGEHRRKGHLGRLVRFAQEKRIEAGTVVVVEAWDRLGRLIPNKQIQLIEELLETGVAIGVCRLDDVFTYADFGTHKWTTLAVFVQLAYQESKQKAERVQESWSKRREQARKTGAMLRCNLPAWIRMGEDGPELIRERAASVSLIFDLAAQDLGYTRIVRRLVAGEVEPFGKGDWCRRYVINILRDRRALGEFQPMKAGEPDGPPLLKFFPPAVTEQQFLLAARRPNGGDGAKRRECRHVNVFRSLLKDARDGSGYLLHNKGTSAAPGLSLVNGSGRNGTGSRRGFPYYVFETAVLRLLREVDVASILPRERDSQVDALRDKVRAALAQVAQYKDDLERDGYSKSIATLLREAEAKAEAAATELQRETARNARPAEKVWQDLPTLADAIVKSADPEAARLRLAGELGRVIEEGRLLIVRRAASSLAALQLFFVGGSVRSYLILHKPAGRNRKGDWWARSLSRDLAGGDLDLRQPKHAEALARRLAVMPLSQPF